MPEVEAHEHTLRWVAPVRDQWDPHEHRPTSAVFRDRHGASVWIRERLLGDPDVLLHRSPKERHGRIALPVGALRALRRKDGTSFDLDVVLDPDGTVESFLDLQEAHAVITGLRGAASAAVIEYVVLHRGTAIEREPQL